MQHVFKQSLDFNKAAPIDTNTALNIIKIKTRNLIRDKNNQLYIKLHS